MSSEANIRSASTDYIIIVLIHMLDRFDRINTGSNAHLYAMIRLLIRWLSSCICMIARAATRKDSGSRVDHVTRAGDNTARSLSIGLSAGK